MDTNSSEVTIQPVVTNSSVETITDESNDPSNEDNSNTKSSPFEVKPETKEKNSKKIVVQSRYMQSTKDWVNKRAEDSHNSIQGPSSRPPSRNPTPERKKTTTSTSTPRSTDKSLNVSGISVINKVNEKLENRDKIPSKTALKKYTKPLVGRKSMAPNRLLFDPESNMRSGPLTVTGLESQTDRNKEFEESIKRSIHLQTIFLNLKAQQSRKERKVDAISKISAVWESTNKMRETLTTTHECVHSLEQLIETIDVLENQSNYFEKYLNIRSKVDPLFNQLSQFIDNQKKLFKIDNCSEEDFHKINELLESCPNSEGSKSSANVTTDLKRAQELVCEIKSMEEELKELQKSFDYCVKVLNKYESLENRLFPERELSLKKMF